MNQRHLWCFCILVLCCSFPTLSVENGTETVALSNKDIAAGVSSSAYANPKAILSLNRLITSSSFSSDYQIKPIGQPKTALNLTHTRYQQYFGGLPVWGKQIAVHQNADGQVVKLNGSIARNIESQLSSQSVRKPAFYADEVIEKLIDQTSSKSELNDKTLSFAQKQADLMVYVDDKNNTHLAYYVSFMYESDSGQVDKPAFIIDANSEAVLAQWSNLQTFEVAGVGGNEKVGKHEYGVDKGLLQVAEVDGTCSLEDDDVKTVTAKGNLNNTKAYYFDCEYPRSDVANGGFSPLNDAYFNSQIVVDLYKNWYGMAPLNFKVFVRGHYGLGYENAFWDGEKVTIGDGKRSLLPLTSLDIVAHEISHGFTQQHSGLIYRYASGGMNEAFSDIAGEAAKYYANGSNDWRIGKNVTKANVALRFMDDPPRDGYSLDHVLDYYNNIYSPSPTGVHSSSGIFNKAFYLLVNTPGWDIRKAFDIFVDANRYYWINDSSFLQGACGVINAAHDRQYDYFEVSRAFEAVGLVCENYPTADNDNDGLEDLWEYRRNFDFNDDKDASEDADNDGLTNLEEYQLGTIFDKPDTDGDTLSDGEEVTIYKTNPLMSDSDEDLMPDPWEIKNGLDPLTGASVDLDSDNDGFTDLVEYQLVTSPVDGAVFPSPMSEYIESFEGDRLPIGWYTPRYYQSWRVHRQSASEGDQSITVHLPLQADPLKTEIYVGNLSQTTWTGYFTEGQLKLDYYMVRRATILRVFLDGKRIDLEGLESQWQTKTFNLSAGIHTFAFEAQTRASGHGIVIDNVRFFANDSDNDGMSDLWEYDNGLDHHDALDANADPDNDGLTNLQESEAGTDPFNSDTDNDGISDKDELNLYGSNPTKADTDRDGLPDLWEITYGLNPTRGNGYNGDSDDDGFTDRQEYQFGTLPNDATSVPQPIKRLIHSFEQDTIPAHFLLQGENRLPGWQISEAQASRGQQSIQVAQKIRRDMTYIAYSRYYAAGELSFDYLLESTLLGSLEVIIDGVSVQKLRTQNQPQWRTFRFSLSEGVHRIVIKNWNVDVPYVGAYIDNFRFFADGLDSDNDGMSDSWEYDQLHDMDDPDDGQIDIDGDGLSTIDEYLHQSNPNIADTDGDGLSDGQEIHQYQTQVLVADSDGDGLFDGWEISYGLNPLNDNDGQKDLDGDGFTNLQEYHFGSSPADPLSIVQTITTLSDSFETNQLHPRWRAPDDVNNGWAIDTLSGSDGRQSIKSQFIYHGQIAAIQLKGLFYIGQFSFDMRRSTEQYYDMFTLTIDGVKVVDGSGIEPWQSFNVELPSGYHTLTFSYQKSPFASDGEDAVWIDNIKFVASDSDHDGLPDGWEIANGFDANDPADAQQDDDNDGLSTLLEFLHGTSPFVADTDNDGLSDGIEVLQANSNPLDVDSDDDGVPDNEDDFPLDPEQSTFIMLSEMVFNDSNLQTCIMDTANTNGWTTVDKIIQLDCSSRSIADLSGLEIFNYLTKLDLRKNNISDINALAGLDSITQLKLSKNKINDIAVLANLSKLTFLSFSDNQVDASQLVALANLTDLQVLYLRDNQIEDISSLMALTKLTRLYLSNNQINDIASLVGLIHLRILDLRKNSISDISSLGDLTALSVLKLANNNINELTALIHLDALTFLSLSNNAFDDTMLDSLADLSHLNTLYLRDNQIADISMLANLSKLTKLYLRNNQIVDISSVANLTRLSILRLSNNLVSDITVLFNLTDTDDINLSDNNTIYCADLDALTAALGQGVVTRPTTCIE